MGMGEWLTPLIQGIKTITSIKFVMVIGMEKPATHAEEQADKMKILSLAWECW